MTETRTQAERRPERLLTGEVKALSVVVILGAVMTILDATIITVALPTLGRDFGASIATIQWVLTIYVLAFAAVIPMTGWASERFGAKTVWLTSLTVFVAGSVLCGLSWSIGSLIAFRAIQGLGGGMVMPLGQTILARAAGPQRMGRVMSIIGVPMLLAPIVGPVIGGAIVGSTSWRWIFFINVPIGALAFALAVRLLPSMPAQRQVRLDARGLVLLSGGIAIFTYGLAEVGRAGTLAAIAPLSWLVTGLALVAVFVVHALRTEQPIIDVRLFARRSFATASATIFMLGMALFAVVLLLPLYFQVVRGRTPLEVGLLLIPQGVGAGLSMPLAGWLTDKVGARRVVPAGLLISLAGTAMYTQIGAGTSTAYLTVALLLVGAGLGATTTPAMAAAFASLSHAETPRASSAINVVARVAGAVGSALLAVVLQTTMHANIAGFHGDIGQAAQLAANNPGFALPRLANAFATTFWVAFGLTAAALIPALLLPRRVGSTSAELRQPAHNDAGGDRVPA